MDDTIRRLTRSVADFLADAGRVSATAAARRAGRGARTYIRPMTDEREFCDQCNTYVDNLTEHRRQHNEQRDAPGGRDEPPAEEVEPFADEPDLPTEGTGTA
jgi:hypothetical protein